MNNEDQNRRADLPSRRLSRRGFLYGSLAAGGASLLAACSAGPGGSSATSGSAGSASGSGGSLKIVNVPKWTTFPYYQACNQGAQQAAKQLGASVTYTGPTSADAVQQVATLQQVVAQRPDIILLAAIEPDNVASVLQQAMRQGITVVTYDSDCTPAARDLYCNQLTYQTAAKAYLDAALQDSPQGGKVVFMAATPTTANHMGQINAMKQLIAAGGKYGAFTPGNTYFCNDDVTTSVTTMTNIMQTDPTVKFMISGSAVSVPAAAQAIDAAGKQGKVFSTGAALPGDIAKYLQDGSEKAFVLWNPVNLGYMAAYAAVLIHQGKLKTTQGSTFKAGSLGSFTVGADKIAPYDEPITFTKSNVSQYSW